MSRVLVSIVSFLALATVAQATPSIPARNTPGVDRAHPNYWLSDGLNRLVFWQPQGPTHADPRKTR